VEAKMRTAKVFRSGNSQAVRIPVEFQFDTLEVEIFRRDNEIVLRKKAQTLAHAFHLLAALPVEFEAQRDDAPPQNREGL
jgi:antitoxin VapB